MMAASMMIIIAPIEQDRAVQAALGPIRTKVDRTGRMIATEPDRKPRKRPPPLMVRRSDGTGSSPLSIRNVARIITRDR